MSRKDALQALEAQLKDTPPSGLARLSGAELADLTDAIREARLRQAAELRAAGERAYAQIPWPLRGPIRKIVG